MANACYTIFGGLFYFIFFFLQKPQSYGQLISDLICQLKVMPGSFPKQSEN